MILSDYLDTVQGSTICIGAENGSGWIYYGECFEGVDRLVDELSCREYERLRLIEGRAKNECENKERSYDRLIVSAEKSLKVAEAQLAKVREQKAGLKFIMDAQDEVNEKKAVYEGVLKPENRKAYYDKLELAVDVAIANRKRFKPLLECEVVKTSYSILNEGAIRILIDSEITGNFWLIEEVQKDPLIRELVREYRKKGA